MESEFNKTELGVDCTFFELPNRAIEAAKDVMARYHTYNEIKREIDRSECFRLALGLIYPEKTEAELLDFNWYPKEVDAVMRYWAYECSNK